MRRTTPAAATAVAALTLLLTACGGADDAGDGADEGSGGSTAAADDRTVVALDDFAAITVLSLGVTPDYVLEAFEYDTTGAIFDELGIETAPYGAELDVEQVLAQEPDLVIGVSLPTTLDHQAALEEVADVAILDYAGTWQEQTRTAAEALGREEVADELEERLTTDLEALAADLQSADLAGQVVSVVGDNGGSFSPPVDTPLGSLLAGAGLERPAAQQVANTPPFASVTLETLTDHDGDVLFLLDEGAYANDVLTGSPLWGQLGAVTAGTVHEVNGETWLGSSAFSVDWVLDDLRSVLVDGGEAAKGADAPQRFADFTAG